MKFVVAKFCILLYFRAVPIGMEILLYMLNVSLSLYSIASSYRSDCGMLGVNKLCGCFYENT